MVRFETKIYNVDEDTGKIIGAEVTVYNESGDKLKSIIVTDETQLQELEAKLDVLDDTYVDIDELNEILLNTREDKIINATKLCGYDGDSFVLASSLDNRTFTPRAHSSSTTEYGGGTSSNYGHLKVRDNLNALELVPSEALSSHQGNVLDGKINALKTIETQSLHSTMKLYKVGNLVFFNIKQWNWNRGDTVGQMVDIGVTIPVEYRPVDDLYMADISDAGLRLHITTSGSIRGIRQNNNTTRQMVSSAVWITNGGE